VASPDCYFVPRLDGSLVLGSTVEPEVSETVVTASGIRGLLDAGRALWPELDRCSFLRAWAGIRPESRDHLPVLGRWPALPNLLVAAGFFKMGITFAPLAAQVVADLLAGKAGDPVFDALSPARFVTKGQPSGR
jgi:glycine oxidase